MDRIYRHQRRIYDPTRKFFLLGRDHLIAALRPSLNGHVIELGCGTARNLIVAARRYPEAMLYGVDISAEMLATARASITRAGLADRILVAEGDASRFDAEALFGRTVFDRAFFSYSLSMIPAWRDAIDLAVNLVADSGELHVVDFGRQDHLPVWFRIGLFAWLGKFHVTPRADLEAQLADTAGRHGCSMEFHHLYRGYASYARLRR